MNLIATDLPDVKRIELNPHEDDRGFFARAFCRDELADAGYPFEVVQANMSFNHKLGTLRGMHYQQNPVGDPKIVRCIKGAVYDVVVDLRPDSPAFCQWTATELSAQNRHAFLIPAGCAHGFLTLTDDAELLYLMGAPFVTDLADGVRWNDPAFGIKWPFAPALINDRDASYPDFKAD
ncbi:dTDP-4-dehydrorhamnose 3,5-epimerase [Thalassospira lucentensis]|uniref:dTDP-4-dehydrorhamnose 3,5-epimerase n=1 Tax=Thalassospira lucentensis TaxID=168935 RepID=A0A154L514_9PROT|nr:MULTISPECIES: dTDP-4-dehydrorhamnose 3,5-epimerase [Thalassospira]KZB62916.1 dTDP-4-dehydrorhamnose 3,5-epimerase [Thalassospira lucentensis]MCH2274817.1 dTDP-4-dehydrorhamnose 3,5-epimerase [Thalassospira sp.]